MPKLHKVSQLSVVNGGVKLLDDWKILHQVLFAKQKIGSTFIRIKRVVPRFGNGVLIHTRLYMLFVRMLNIQTNYQLCY